MARFEVAHLHQQGQDMIIVPLDRQFQYQTDAQRAAWIEAFQVACHGANLRGTVCPVWPGPTGRMMFIAPTPLHPFFRNLSLQRVQANLNRWIEV